MTHLLSLEIRDFLLRTTLDQKLSFALLLSLPSRSRLLVLSFGTFLGVEFDLYGASSSVVGVLKEFSGGKEVGREKGGISESSREGRRGEVAER